MGAERERERAERERGEGREWSELKLRGKGVRSWCDGSSDRSFMGLTH